MKQVININFHGRVVPIEVSAFDLLKKYTESLSSYFANEEGKEEIINDIESRIGELFQERLKTGSPCITDDDVNAIIKSMGRPEEFEEQGQTGSAQQNKNTTTTSPTHKRLYRDENDKVLGGVCSGLANYFAIDPIIVRIVFLIVMCAFGTGLLAYIILWLIVPSTSTTEIGGTRKKLFRDPDNKLIAGVCSGISNYFGISTWIPRLLFLLPFISFAFHFNRWNFMGPAHFFGISFSPGVLIIYIILWLVMPEANTTAEKLEMKGEKVDMNSIKNSIATEMKDAKVFAAEKGKAMAADINTASKHGINSLGDIIGLFFKIIGYFILGCIGFALVMALFGVAIASIAIFPLKDFILTEGWQNIFAWGTLIFFIAMPIIGIITWIIRRFAKSKNNNITLRIGFFGLWIIGWLCFILLISSVVKDFRASNNVVMQDVHLSNPTVNKLEIAGQYDIIGYNYKNNYLHFSPFTDFENEDSFFLSNVHFRIIKSANDSFQVSIIKLANGKNHQSAENIAAQITYTPVQIDSILKMPLGIPIDRKNKFRNQHVIITIAVPVNKRIQIDQAIWQTPSGKFNIGWDDENWDDYWGNEERHWTTNTEYIQKVDGLYKVDNEGLDEIKGERPEIPERLENQERSERVL